jgi:hypothetical protein
MKRILKSTIIIFLFPVSTAFLFRDWGSSFDSHAGENDSTTEYALMADLSTTESRTKSLPAGQWGGQHISMDVTGKGATVEYDCAHATIERRISIDRSGRFDVPGMQSPERGGPVRQGQDTGYSVRFKGQVNGKTMTLSVTNSLTKELIGTFTLVHGVEPRLMKCK